MSKQLLSQDAAEAFLDILFRPHFLFYCQGLCLFEAETTSTTVSAYVYALHGLGHLVNTGYWLGTNISNIVDLPEANCRRHFFFITEPQPGVYVTVVN